MFVLGLMLLAQHVNCHASGAGLGVCLPALAAGSVPVYEHA